MRTGGRDAHAPGNQPAQVGPQADEQNPEDQMRATALRQRMSRRKAQSAKQPDAKDDKEPAERTTLRWGASGPEVEELQELLSGHGATLEPDGKYGPKTVKAVIAFQKANGLSTDGVVGPKTWDALDGEAAPVTPEDKKEAADSTEVEEKKPTEDQASDGEEAEEKPDADREEGEKGGEQVLSSARQGIVDVARGELGNGIAAKLPGDKDETGKMTRQGWQKLLEIFTVGYGGDLPGNLEQVVKYHKFGMQGGGNPNGLQHWCGIFCAYVLKTAGIPCKSWKIGGVMLGPPTRDPQPGDIGYLDEPYQHHCIVVAVEGDRIVSVDGNTGADSSVQLKERSRGQFSLFMKANAS